MIARPLWEESWKNQPKIFFTSSNKPSSALAATLQTPSSATTTTTVCHSPDTSAKPASDTGPEVELSEMFPLVVAGEKTSVSNVQTVTLLLTLILLPPIQTLPHYPTSFLLQFIHSGGLPDLLVHGGFCDQAEDHEAVVGAIGGIDEGGFDAAAGLGRR